MMYNSLKLNNLKLSFQLLCKEANFFTRHLALDELEC